MTKPKRKYMIPVVFTTTLTTILFISWLSGLDFERGVEQAYWFATALVCSALMTAVITQEMK